jgi:AmiR/NasT family two-component response regulator
VDEQLADCELLVENLYISQEHRGIIDQAIGILMAPGGRTADDALRVLIQASQRQNRKLRDIAGDMVAVRSKPVTPKVDGSYAPKDSSMLL